MSAPIELYYWPTPNGWKISIALEEMGLPYNLNLVNIGKGEQFAPDFLKLSPNNRMPAIVDPDGPDGAPVSVFESGAILQYLARKTGRFHGETERERIEVDQWLMWQMGGVGPMAGQAHHFLAYAPTLEPPQVLPYAQTRYRNEVERLYGVLEAHSVTQIECKLGEPVDITVQEVVVTDEGEGTLVVLEELQRGYRMHDRLLRPTQVRLGPRPDATSGPATNGGEQGVDASQAVPPAGPTRDDS